MLDRSEPHMMMMAICFDQTHLYMALVEKGHLQGSYGGVIGRGNLDEDEVEEGLLPVVASIYW